MACGSCGQKYRALGATRGPVYNYHRNNRLRRFTEVAPKLKETIDVPQPAVTVQEDIKEAVKGTESEYPVDPSSGLKLDILKTGSCPENDLGDTAPQPTNLESVDIPEAEAKNNVGG